MYLLWQIKAIKLPVYTRILRTGFVWFNHILYCVNICIYQKKAFVRTSRINWNYDRHQDIKFCFNLKLFVRRESKFDSKLENAFEQRLRAFNTKIINFASNEPFPLGWIRSVSIKLRENVMVGESGWVGSGISVGSENSKAAWRIRQLVEWDCTNWRDCRVKKKRTL